jgi:hypothetical protein
MTTDSRWWCSQGCGAPVWPRWDPVLGRAVGKPCVTCQQAIDTAAEATAGRDVHPRTEGNV